MITQARQQTEFFGKLSEIASLFKLQTAIIWALRAAACGLAADAALLIVSRYRAFTPPSWWLVAVPLLLALAGGLAGFLQRYPEHAVAVRADSRLSLKERLTTALELQRRGEGGVLAEAQFADAMWHLRLVEPWRNFPPRIPTREGGTVLAAIGLTAALLLLPNPAKSAIEQQAAATSAIKQEAQQLQKTATQIKQNEDLTGNHSADQQTVEQILQQLQQQLQQPSLSAEDALAKLQQAQQQLQSNQDPNADQLNEALQALAAQFDTQSQLQQVAQDIRGGNYSAAAQALNNAGQQASSLSQSQRDQLAQSLRAAAAAQAKAGNSQLGDSLSQAADSLSSGSQADTSAAFRQASTNLQNAGQHAQAQQNLSTALSQVQQSANNVAQQAGQSAADNGSAFSSSPQPNGQPGDASAGANSGSSDQAQGQAGQSGAQDGLGQIGQPGQGQGQGSGQQGTGQGGQNGSQGNGGQSADTVYTGSPSTNFQGVPGQQQANGQVSTGDDNSLSNPAQNGSNVPYQQVIGQYQQQATQAMDRESVPLSYREVVKNYFSSLGSQQH